MKMLVINVLQARFGSVPDGLEEQLNAIDDLGIFERLGVQAAVAPTLEDFRKAIVQ